ncbi:glycosyltransferase family 1 protein [Mucidula mucida]|nr:glycosyltransferase family 1 protein [Mucidula mucida]
MLAFVTVGSTRFDALVEAVISKDVLAALQQKGYTELVVQCGHSDLGVLNLVLNKQGKHTLQRHGVALELWRFKPSLKEDFTSADLVISHAGSGTILDVLRLGKALIVVPNPTLLDNHQEELAVSLSNLGHLKATTIPQLAMAIADFDKSGIVAFPPFDPSKFRQIVDEEMGFEIRDD